MENEKILYEGKLMNKISEMSRAFEDWLYTKAIAAAITKDSKSNILKDHYLVKPEHIPNVTYSTQDIKD